MSNARSRLFLISIAVYLFLGMLLIAQGPGLQFDEALLVSGAVHMRHSPAMFDILITPDSWVCPFGRCIPLMSAFYVGAVKEYAVLPFFAIFGPRLDIIRIISLLLSGVGLWGIYRLVSQFFGVAAAGIATLLLAVNPAYLYMAVFDNNAIGATMAGLGLTCGCLAIYLQRRSFSAAVWLGLALGFSVWARANFVWVLAAGVVAGAIVFRRRLFPPLAHWAALLIGGLVGAFPFLLFQILSNGSTWKAQGDLTVNTPMATLLRQRIFWFADTLLSDGEHRRMWAGPSLPQWQLWLFPMIVCAACLMSLVAVRLNDQNRRAFARAVALTFVLTGASLFFSRLPIAEHHLIILLPLAAAMIVVAGSSLWESRTARIAFAGLFFVYLSSACYWQFTGLRGLRKTGGVGMWSDASLQLARYLDQNLHGERAIFLDWGFRYNTYVLSDGTVKSWDVYSGDSEETDAQGQPWLTLIRRGGVFVVSGPENRTFPRPSAGFLRALATNRPQMQMHRIFERNGETYAEVIQITPNSVRTPDGSGAVPVDHIEMGNVRFNGRLSGFYPPEEGRYRWTKREFSVRFDLAGQDATNASQLVMRLYVPDVTIQKLGSVTLQASVAGHALPAMKWSQSGQYVYRCEVEPGWAQSGHLQVNFSLSNAFSPGGEDHRELGIVVNDISLEPF